MVIMPYLWTTTPKVHMKVYSDISTRMLSTWTFVDIYHEVAKSDIREDDDIVATTMALRLLRDERRKNRSQD